MSSRLLAVFCSLFHLLTYYMRWPSCTLSKPVETLFIRKSLLRKPFQGMDVADVIQRQNAFIQGKCLDFHSAPWLILVCILETGE